MHAKSITAALVGLIVFVSYSAAAERFPYQDPHLPMHHRIADLIGRMTLEEKASQLQQVPTADLVVKDGRVTSESMDKLFKGLSRGTLEGLYGTPVQKMAVMNRDGQQYARSKTRLGIPMLPSGETLHGLAALGATIYPQTIAQGATWNVDLIHEMACQIAEEAHAAGVVQAMAPMLDLAREPRWGRVEECFSECPYLTSRMVVAYIKGMQGDDPRAGIPPGKLPCMSKVIAGYCVPRNGINIAPSSIGEREMRSLFLVPHEAAVREAHVACVMPSYHAVDGVPAHANTWLLTKVLRGEWGFQGYVYSDWMGIEFNADVHKIVPDRREAAVVSLKAGVDLEAPEPNCYKFLPELVREGKISEKLVDRAVARVLRIKFLAGLFDGKRAALSPEEIARRVHTPEHVALARRMAEESVILLKNEKGLLPLDKGRIGSIAVIGPNADQVQFGDYSPTKDNRAGVTVLQGIRALVADSGVKVRYARGCGLLSRDKSGFAEAVEAGRQSDVAVVVIGDESMIYGDGMGGEIDKKFGKVASVGEGYDRTELTPPGVQEDLVKAVHAAGKPVIVVMVQGRHFAVPWIKANIPAVLTAFFPGEQGGRAIAEILFGGVNPSGRLPVTIPQSVGHIPCTYDYLPCERGYYHVPGTPDKPGRDYVFASPNPLWPFGFGLGYTTFAYSDLKIEPAVITANGTAKVSFRVKNTGSREGKEVAQVYYRDCVSSVLTPMLRLVRFQKVHLKPGESRLIELEINAAELALWNMEMKRVVEPGEFKISVGASAEDLRLSGRLDVRE